MVRTHERPADDVAQYERSMVVHMVDGRRVIVRKTWEATVTPGGDLYLFGKPRLLVGTGPMYASDTILFAAARDRWCYYEPYKAWRGKGGGDDEAVPA